MLDFRNFMANYIKSYLPSLKLTAKAPENCCKRKACHLSMRCFFSLPWVRNFRCRVASLMFQNKSTCVCVLPAKTNMEAEHDGSQKEFVFPEVHFSGSMSVDVS